ncbi:hypothetical protein ScPMuIL_010983 [Solemya velum]
MAQDKGAGSLAKFCSSGRCSLVLLLGVLVLAAVIVVVTLTGSSLRVPVVYVSPSRNVSRDWWKKSIVYQIYPRSFQDSDGDGVGDIKGIIQRLDHLVYLHVGIIWISPFYVSPMKDFGYDVSNYTDVDPLFGNLTDFEELVTRAHTKGIKVIVDFVPNHTSDRHSWFQLSRQGVDTHKDYYIWDKGVRLENGTFVPPNNWIASFGGPAWSWDDTRQAFYYHAYLPEQPDLNIRSPAVQKELKDVLRFWLNKEVDGFRIDAVVKLLEARNTSISNEPLYTGDTVNPYFRLKHTGITMNNEDIGDVLKDWRNLLDEYENKDGKYRLMIAEAYSQNASDYAVVNMYYDWGADIPFNSNLATITRACVSRCIRDRVEKYLNSMPRGRQPNFVLGSHDVSRVATRMGSRHASALNMLLLTLPGTPTTYYGEEIGMSDIDSNLFEMQDPRGRRLGRVNIVLFSRDPERSPMQWSSAWKGDFSQSMNTWLPVNRDFLTHNVKMQKESSTMTTIQSYRRLAEVRQRRAFYNGTFQFSVTTDTILSYVRAVRGEKYLIAINFGFDESLADFSGKPVDSNSGKVVAFTEDTQYEYDMDVDIRRLSLPWGQGVVVRVQ